MRNSASVMCFKAYNDIFVHWIKNWHSGWGQQNKLHICQVGNGRMCCTVVKDKSNISFIHAEFPNKFTEPVFKDLIIPLTLLLRDILARQIFNIFKTVWLFWFAYNKHWKRFSCSTSCRHSSYSYFAFLPSGAL